MIDNGKDVGNLTYTMCTLTITCAEALVRYEDGSVHVVCELACGCVRLRPATLADLERGLPLIESQPDSEWGDDGVVVALPSPGPLPLAA